MFSSYKLIGDTTEIEKFQYTSARELQQINKEIKEIIKLITLIDKYFSVVKYSWNLSPKIHDELILNPMKFLKSLMISNY